MGKRSGNVDDGENGAVLCVALDQMEPNLRLLQGVVAVLKGLSEAADAVEPIALEAIAHLAGETVQEVVDRWQEAREAMRQC
jgi:hypothetical protein